MSKHFRVFRINISRMKFTFVNGPTSSNKTKVILSQSKKRYLSGQKTLIVGASIDGIEECGERFRSEHPGIPLEIYHSKQGRQDSCGSIRIDVERALKDESLGNSRIVAISHATFCSLSPALNVSEWHVAIDETLDVFHPAELNLQDSHSPFTENLEALPFGPTYSKLHSINDTTLRSIAENRNRDEYRKIVQNIAVRMINPNYDHYTRTDSYRKLLRKSGKQQKFYCASILHPRVCAAFASVTVFSARFEESLHYHIWKHEGVEWEQNEELSRELRFREHTGYEKTKIYWGYERNYSKSVRNREPDFYKAFIDSGLKLIGGKRFIRLENNDIKETSSLARAENGETIPGRPHGLNRYRHIDHAIVIPAMNYAPMAGKLLFELFGLSREKQAISFACHNIYQAISRTSMRDGDLSRERIWVVPSEHHATYLCSVFQGATSNSLSLVQPSAGKRGRSSTFDSSKDRKNQSKQINRNKMRQKKDFISQIATDMIENVIPFHSTDDDVNTLIHIDKFVDTYRSSWFDHKKQKFGKVILMKENDYMNWFKKESKKSYTRKDDVPLVSSAFYNPLYEGEKKRGKQAVVFASGVMLDFDDTDLEPKDLAKILSDLQLLTYSTYSNSPNNLRYRAYIPTTRPMFIPEYKVLVDGIIRSIEEAGYFGKDQSPAKPNGSDAEGGRDRFTAPPIIEGPVKRHGIDMGKRGPYSLFHLPCRSPNGGGFCIDHSGPGRGPLDVNVWLLALQSIKRPKAILTYTSDDCSHSLTDQQRDDTEAAMEEWFTIGTRPGEGDGAMWALYKRLRDLRLPADVMEDRLRFAADTANTPSDRHTQVDNLMFDLRTFRAKPSFYQVS
ncbi:hypothetical protein ACLBXB_21175 [Methylobacterium mesophilicum]